MSVGFASNLWYANGFGGLNYYNHQDSKEVCLFERGFLSGLSIGRKCLGLLQVEGEFTHRENPVTLMIDYARQGTRIQNNVMANALFEPLAGLLISPYLGVGAGGLFQDTTFKTPVSKSVLTREAPFLSASNSFSIQEMVGLRLNLGSRAAVGAELRQTQATKWTNANQSAFLSGLLKF